MPRGASSSKKVVDPPDPSDVSDSEGWDEPSGAGGRTKRAVARMTTTLYKDLRRASVEADEPMGNLITEGLRHVLYGADCRHKGILVKARRS